MWFVCINTLEEQSGVLWAESQKAAYELLNSVWGEHGSYKVRAYDEDRDPDLDSFHSLHPQ